MKVNLTYHIKHVSIVRCLTVLEMYPVSQMVWVIGFHFQGVKGMPISHEEFHRLVELGVNITEKEQDELEQHLIECKECFLWYKNEYTTSLKEELMETIFISEGFLPKKECIENLFAHLEEEGLLL